MSINGVNVLVLSTCLVLIIALVIPYSDIDEAVTTQNPAEVLIATDFLSSEIEQRAQLGLTNDSSFSEMPLFNSTRQKQKPKPVVKKVVESEPPIPPVEKIEPIKVQKPKPRIPSLIGIMLVDNVQAAFVKTDEEGTQLLKPGQRYKDWYVEDITADSLVLSFEEFGETITLFWAGSELLENKHNTDQSIVKSNSDNITTTPITY